MIILPGTQKAPNRRGSEDPTSANLHLNLLAAAEKTPLQVPSVEVWVAGSRARASD